MTLSMLDEALLKAKDDKDSPSYRHDLQYLLNTDAATRISLSFKEYLDSGIKVGDRVSVAVAKLKDSGPESVIKLLEQKENLDGRRTGGYYY